MTERDTLVERLRGELNAHFEKMQGMCSRYLEPNGYYIDREDTIHRGDPEEAEAFIADMIYMLDGPEQRAAQALAGPSVRVDVVEEWRDIETAPKDGTIILLGGGTWGDDDIEEAPRVMAARWYEPGRDYPAFWNVTAAEAGYSCFPYDSPTHWRPLPDPPATRALAGPDGAEGEG